MIKIEIIGTEDIKQKQLVRNVQQALDALGMTTRIKIISNWEDIVIYRIIKTPALIVNQQVLSQGFVPESREIQGLLSSFCFDGNSLSIKIN